MECKERETSRFHLDLINGAESREAFAAMLNEGFKVPEGHGFLDDFPIWDERIVPSGEKIVRLGAYVSGSTGPAQALAACAGVRMASLSTPSGHVSIALVGAVATREEYRGEGLASSLVNLASEWAKTRGALAIFLWGSEYSLYRRLGFELCGQQVTRDVDALSLKGGGPCVVNEGWSSAVFRALKARGTGVAHFDEDEVWLSAHKNVEWFWIGERHRCDAYVGIGRGIDLQDFVHEWGGDPGLLHQLLKEVRGRRPGLKMIGSPDLFKRSGLATDDMPVDYLCLAKILDCQRLFEAFFPTSAFPDHPQMTAVQSARFLFGPNCEGDTHPRLRSPAALWIWGLDAV